MRWANAGTRPARRAAAAACALLTVLLLPASAAAHGGDGEHTFRERAGGRVVRVSTHADRFPRLPAAQRRRLAGESAFRTRSVGAPRFAAGWCGREQTQDYTAASLGDAPAIKVVYAYPSDVGDRFSTYADFIQREAQAVYDRMAAVPGATKSVRFDVGTDCSANPLDYVDIETIALPGTAADYRALDSASRLARVKDVVRRLAGPQEGIRDYLVFADGLYAGDGIRGQGERIDDDSHGAAINAQSTGDLYAVVYGDGTQGDFFGGTEPYFGRYAGHEIGHLLGAVQDSAPHATGATHCWDEWDVMCYDDGGPLIPDDAFGPDGAPASQQCGAAEDEVYDCGQDDYLNPDPQPGSYLATHWNLQDSRFMCPISSCQTPTVPPKARITGPAHANAGAPVTFSAAGSTDADGRIVGYAWDLDGDGTYETPTGEPTVTTTYGDSVDGGSLPQRVGVQVFDDDGAVGTASLELHVFGPLTAEITAPSATVPAGQPIGFTVVGGDPDGDPVVFGLDFDGDGTVDRSGPTPDTVWRYATPGTYHPAVTVGDGNGPPAEARTTLVVTPRGSAAQSGAATDDGGSDAGTVTISAGDPEDRPRTAGTPKRQRLRRVVRRGLRYRVHSPRAPLAGLTVTISARAARALGLRDGGHGRVRVAHTRRPYGRHVANGRLRLDRRARRALWRSDAHRVRLLLLARPQDEGPVGRRRVSAIR